MPLHPARRPSAYATQVERLRSDRIAVTVSDELFQEGGPHRIKRTATGEFSMRIDLPVDDDKMLARECPGEDCAPAYFKVRPGTGLSDQEKSFCPYCRGLSPAESLYTKAQLEYAKNIAFREAQKGLGKMLENAFGLGPTGRKKVGGGFFSMELQYKPAPLPNVHRPAGEELRRDLRCPHCQLEHSVFGLATWCPDCGADIFLAHVKLEFDVIERMLGDVVRRRGELGARVAARDIENALEDSVSIFEAVLRILTRRSLAGRGITPEQIDETLRKKVANRYQNVNFAVEVVRQELGAELFRDLTPDEVARLQGTFEKRHPITHNLGIVDRKYLEKAQSGELEGRDVRVTVSDVQGAIALACKALTSLHGQLFPPPSEASGL